MKLTRKFYSRFNEATKHMAAVLRSDVAYSRTAHAADAITIRLEGPAGAVQILRMSAKDAGGLGGRLVLYAEQDRIFRGE